MGTITRSFANKVTADGVSSLDSTVITGATAETTIAGGDSVLIFDDSASALRKMTRTNFVSGLGGLVGFATAKQPNTSFINSTSFTSTGLTLNYTPVNGASNKIIVILQGGYGQDDQNNTNSQTRIRQTANTAYDVFSENTGVDITEGASFNGCHAFVLDTNVISNTQLTYQWQGKSDDSNSDYRPFDYTTLSVMEIAV